MARTTSRGQRVIQQRSSPNFLPPQIQTGNYLTEELQVGDVVTYVPGTVSNVVPLPAASNIITVNGSPQGASYTVGSGDVGKVFQVTQFSSNPLGSDLKQSNTVTAIAVQTAFANGWLGSNTTQPASYTPSFYLANGAQGGRKLTDQSGNPLPASSFNATGWPNVAFQVVITATLSGSGLDGQLASGTYQGSYRLMSAQPGWTPSGGNSYIDTGLTSGVTVTNQVLQSDHITVKFQAVFPLATNATFVFTGGIAYLDLPRDFSTPTWGGPEFDPTCIASLARHNSMRMMDVNASIPPSTFASQMRAGQDAVVFSTGSGTTDFTTVGAPNNILGTIFTATGTPTGSGSVLLPEVTWANRIVDYGTTGPAWPFSLERQIRLMNAVCASPGSNIKSVWFNLGPFVTPDYASHAAALLTSTFTGGVPLYIELGNEPWNTGSTIYGMYSGLAWTETKTVAARGSTTTNIFAPTVNAPSIVNGYSCTIASLGSTDFTTIGAASNTIGTVFTATGPATGTGTVTVYGTITGDGTTATCVISKAATMPSFITNGATFIMNNQSTAIWSQDAAGVTYGIGHVATITSVNATTFTFSCKGSGSMLITNAWQMYFNPSSQLLLDQNYDINQLIYKYYTRQVYLTQQAFKTAGRNDRFVLNLQLYGGYGSAIVNFMPIHYTYASVIANAINPGTSITDWLYGTAVAPYIKAQGRYASASTATPNQIFGVAWAATAAVGDSITISGAGAAGASLVTTVAAGSSGTTLNIAGSVLTNVTATTATTTSPPTITYTDGNSTAILNCMLASAIPQMEQYIRTHAYVTKMMGVKMMAYEASIDIQAIPNQQVSISNNSLLSTVITKLYDLWFGCGGQEIYAFSAVPGIITNVAQGSWNWLTTWADSTSPKIAALLAYRTSQIAYKNLFTPSPGAAPVAYTWQTSGLGNTIADNSVMVGKDALGNSLAINTTNGMCYWGDNTGARNAGWLLAFPRTRRYSATISGSDSTAGTVALLYVDGVQVGSATLPANGSGSNSATVAGSAAVVNLTGGNYLRITSGSHNVEVKFTGSAPNKGTVPGIFSVQFTLL